MADRLESAQEAIRKALELRPMVQVIVLTIDGQKVVCIGPMVHVPDLGVFAGDVQEVEFGEIIPAHLAVRLFNGEFSRGTKQ